MVIVVAQVGDDGVQREEAGEVAAVGAVVERDEAGAEEGADGVT